VPTFLSDPTRGFYLVLIAFAVVAAVLVGVNRTRRRWLVFGSAAALLLAVYATDALVESPREEATRKVKAMADAATATDPNRFVEHVSPTFAATGGATREKLRLSPVWGLIRERQARVAVWGFGHDSFDRISTTEVEVGFYAKAEADGGGMVMRYCKTRFVQDPDGQYRMSTIKFYNPADRGIHVEDPIPGFP
jgi:hypothetical protein